MSPCAVSPTSPRGTPVRPETRFQIGSISKSFAGIVAMQEVEAGRLDLHVERERDPALARAARAVRPDHPAPPDAAHGRARDRHRGGADAARARSWLLRGLPPTTPPGERFWYSNDGWKIVGACLEHVTGIADPRPARRSALRAARHAGLTARASPKRSTWRTAVGYEPTLWDRPAQLRHPLSPAPRIVSNTADGSIVSTALDMAAYARLLLARGDVPDGRGGRILSEATFDRAHRGRRRRRRGRRYAYGLWREEVGRPSVDRAHRRHGRLHGAPRCRRPTKGSACVDAPERGRRQAGGGCAPRSRPFGRVWPAPSCPPRGRHPAATAIPKAEEYVGRYRGRRRPGARGRAVDDGLGVAIGPLAVRLERDPLEPRARRRVPRRARGARSLPAGVRSRRRRARRRGVPRVDLVPARRRDAGAETRPLPGVVAAAIGLLPEQRSVGPTWCASCAEGRPGAAVAVRGRRRPSTGTLIPLDDGSFAVGAVRDPRRIRFVGDIEGRRSWPSTTADAGTARSRTERRGAHGRRAGGSPFANQADRLAVGPHVESRAARARAS